jgi:hypothetical protein
MPRRHQKQLDELRIRLDVLRNELSMFAATFDDDDVMARTAQLEVALFNPFNQASWDRIRSPPKSRRSYIP